MTISFLRYFFFKFCIWVTSADVVLFSKLMHLQCTMIHTMSFISDWEVRRLGMRERVKTRSPDLDIFTKIAVFCGKKTTNLGSTVHYTYMSYKNISDFLWFQRICGSMKSVYFFSSIDDIGRVYHFIYFKTYSPGVLVLESGHISNIVKMHYYD